MAIAHVVSGGSSGSFTLASSGSNRFLIAFSGPNISALTFDSVSLTNSHTYTPTFPSGTNCPSIKVWILANPNTGTKTLQPTGTGHVVASIYSGVSPGAIESYVEQDSNNIQAGSWTGQATITTPNSWAIMCVRVSNYTGDINAGSSTTERITFNTISDDSISILDSNTAVSPGTRNVNATLPSSSGFWTSISISLTPVFESKGSFLQYF